jgi:methionyl-tRNA synthetase
MRIANIQQARFAQSFGIDMASIADLSDTDNVSAAYGVVAPGKDTVPHKHDESEAFVIISGDGEIVTDGRHYPVSAGSVVMFEPFESHVLRNTGQRELRFTDFYWRDPAKRAAAARENARSRLTDRPVFVFSTPPTPNGDLHLGHLSGPYLGADIYVRFLRATGHEAYHLTGSDDYQSYVVGRAQQEDSSPQEIASRYSAAIKETLDMMDIDLDQYTVTSRDPSYASGLRGFFSRLVKGGMRRMTGPALFDGKSGAYLHEVDVSGNCPTCGSPSGGNICEECGEPNTCVEFAAPRSRLSDAPPKIGEIERYAINLSEFKDAVETHHRRGKVSPRLQELANKVLSRKDFHVPISHPAQWGVPPSEAVEGQQVIWVWPEMAYGFLHSIAEIGRRTGKDWRADQPEPDWKIVHFFGYDNSFYHTILFPALYSIAFPEWQCDIDYNENEFYLLDGLKFSTSRRHAIWGKDILTPDSVDAVRYYLAWTRGEQERANFTLADFHRRVDELLVGQWQSWLADLGGRVGEDFSGRAPDAGSWTPAHIGYFNSLQNRLTTITTYYGADGFSLNRVVDELNALVANALRMAKSHERIRHNAAVHGEYRTAIALELATARLLAHIAAPLMPRFASKLAQALDMDNINAWPDTVKLLPADSKVALADQVFFASQGKRGEATEGQAA